MLQPCRLNLYAGQLYNERRTWRLIGFTPQSGLELSLRNFRLEPVYPPSKGKFIRLPGGGKLESLILPEKASFDLHYLAAVWQSWLWKLTGVVLPVKEGGSAKNSLVFRKGNLHEGSWKIKVNSSGGELLYSWEPALWPALCEYMRKLGVVYYDYDCHKIPAAKTDLVLPAIDQTINPRFHYMKTYGLPYGAISWTLCRGQDWYSLPWAREDHTMNILLPMWLYREKHPEYYMLEQDGSRQKAINPGLMIPCLTNPEVRKIFVDNFGDLVRSAGQHFIGSGFELGDRPDFCHCPNCRKNSNSSYSDVLLDIANRAARKAAGIHPDFKVHYCAYLVAHEPPKTVVKPEPNVMALVCMPPYTNPCEVHLNCPENRKAVDDLIGWSKLLGPDRVGVGCYEEERPYHYIKRLEFYNRYAKAYLQLWSDDPLIFYLSNRWMMGDDGNHAIQEFNDAYFGKAGKYVTKIQRTVEDFCEKYQHRPGEITSPFHSITVMTGIYDRHTILTREVFDRIYPLFDQAFSAVGEKTSPERTHLLIEKYKFLRMDLAKYRYTDCGNDAEVKAFAARLKTFIEISGELNQLKLPYHRGGKFKQDVFYAMPVRKFMQMVAGLNLPTTVQDWTKEPALLDFMRNMESRLILKPQEIPGGTLFMPGLMRGGTPPTEYSYQCPKMLCTVIKRASSGFGTLSVNLKLAKKPDAPLLLVAEGLDDDKPGASTMEISVNGKVIFSGANTFEEHNWTKMIFTIPADCLKAGDNRIVFRNTVKDRKDKIKDDNGDFMGQSGIQDYTWGWISFSRIYVLDISSEFQKFLSGDPKSAWKKITWMNKPEGPVEVKDGKLFMQSKGAPFTGIYMALPKPCTFSVTPGEKIRMTVTAKGTGMFGYWSYGMNGKFLSKCGTLNYVSTKELKKHSAVFTVAKGVEKITLYITAAKNGITVESVEIETVR